jgi:acetate kinase
MVSEPAVTPSASEMLLVLNCGSSSIKFALFDFGREPMPRRPEWGGKIGGIGQPEIRRDLSECAARGKKALLRT